MTIANTVKITGENYIGFQKSSNGTITFKTHNPATKVDNTTIFYEACDQEIEDALSLAQKAFPFYKETSAKQRANFLRTIAEEIENLGETLINMYCNETGLSKNRAHGEKARTLLQLRLFADVVEEYSWIEACIETSIPERKPIPKPDIRKMNIPIGPVVVFGASNFPLAYSTAGGDTASALAAGCPVIVKSHPMHSGTGTLIASAIVTAAKKTNMPNGVFSNLNSKGIAVGQKLVQHPATCGVGFTGSITGGRALLDIAAKRDIPIPVFAEMGSINPVVLLPEALKTRGEELAVSFANSITTGSGQFCTKPGLLLAIDDAALQLFLKKLKREIIAVEPSCMLHPKIKGAFEKNREKIVEQKHVSSITATNHCDDNYGQPSIASITATNFLKNQRFQEEVFGPFSLVVICKDKNQIAAVLQSLQGQLTGTIIGNNSEIKEYKNIITVLSSIVGRLIFNGVPTGVEVCNAMVHGGPYPASTDSRFTAVGANSIKRWVRPFSFQNWPDSLLPVALQNENTLKIKRLVNNQFTNSKI
ncbi:aldehyde dehydrogenase (NADP(+)) [Tenacibaculum sp. SG-28]|uniref:aldehyde dehydrogenase (NADP(+)) n=1 Tax=Tenacibaculum sp. SG-28 TaxID=754426 RepID=UPI000CF44E31|nr:aldehyde dehydrogenase (NADP(+)) [Tenacibaculum sp. SG-28]PQJ22789.1 aldehyde dehydrogenase (NADP(+)) [Tenacibaculum sp. SG-28]